LFKSDKKESSFRRTESQKIGSTFIQEVIYCRAFCEWQSTGNQVDERRGGVVYHLRNCDYLKTYKMKVLRV